MAASKKKTAKKKTSKKTSKKVTKKKGSKKTSATASAEPFLIHAVSDSTGNLPRHMLAAFLTQFPVGAFTVRHHTFVNAPDRIDTVVDALAERPGRTLLLHALVDPKAKQRIEAGCQKHNVPCRDLTGPFVQMLAEHSGHAPSPDRRRLHRIDEQYRRRIEAIDFTIAHDDSQGARNLHEADIVLVGVSRTSKTPTSIFLAQRGFRVANVAIAPESPLPDSLQDVPPQRVIGLTIDPDVLLEIRTRRWATFIRGGAGSRYTDPLYIEEELDWSRRLFRRHGWSVIDVTNQAIEETAGRILNALGLEEDTSN